MILGEFGWFFCIIFNLNRLLFGISENGVVTWESYEVNSSSSLEYKLEAFSVDN